MELWKDLFSNLAVTKLCPSTESAEEGSWTSPTHDSVTRVEFNTFAASILTSLTISIHLPIYLYTHPFIYSSIHQLFFGGRKQKCVMQGIVQWESKTHEKPGVFPTLTFGRGTAPMDGIALALLTIILFTRPSIYLFTYPSTYLSIHLSTHIFIYLSLVCFLSVNLSYESQSSGN